MDWLLHKGFYSVVIHGLFHFGVLNSAKSSQCAVNTSQDLVFQCVQFGIVQQREKKGTWGMQVCKYLI